MYPENDNDYTEVSLTEVREDTDGWIVRGSHGFSFFVPSSSPIEPKVNMSARIYSRGIGYAIRGLFIADQKVYYRSREDDIVHQDEQRFGKDAAALLEKWDNGDVTHSIEMGGLGPGYEQAIQVAMFEMLRLFVSEEPDIESWKSTAEWDIWKERAYNLPSIRGLGLSGSQAAVAISLASAFYMKGPIACMNEVDSNRHIMVSNKWPSLSKNN